jgi:hypothetical protein
MSLLDKNNNIKPAKTNNFSLLNQAEIALTVGAIFGFLAVLSLLLLPWSLALFAAGVTMVALVVAVVILSIPPYPIASLSMKPEEESPNPPKNQGGGLKSSDFTPSTRQILESTASNKDKDIAMVEIRHFSSPLSVSKAVDTQEVIKKSEHHSASP